ncbi:MULTISPECIES: aspartate-semialdehyde dehydrogenase [unclassified Haematospirillum]|uniref:aspartate-semialdehyde dehydrogenase n=1 Tax=unclassified Haematospirillum TaxID=2622088 RepID=UPI001439A729|nr:MULTISPECIES: aspartate-semialdehyde dehydrogenase [unclassified Haematospirillum]NKD54659.1 aspartate-semialdehyde dehydrogenase [Haematospirillum sp. H4890]NKD74729.1 aspartate-semialdehyde dehydrogenase [Haematospirillum sp. H4485]
MSSHTPAAARIVLVGASGHLAREILDTLAERDVPAVRLVALDSQARIGREVSYGDDDVLKVSGHETFDFRASDRVVLATEPRDASAVASRAMRVGALVIDLSGHFRRDPSVPLVVAGVNPANVDRAEKKGVLAVPSPMALMVSKVLAPLHDRFGLVRVVASTYESTSGAGREGMDELFRQTRGIYVNEPPASSREVFPKQIAFNVIPQVGSFSDMGATEAEDEAAAGLARMLPGTAIHVNCARVAAFVGAAAYINIQCESPVSEQAVRELLRESDSVSVVDHRVEEGYVTPAETSGEEPVFVSRLRGDISVENGLSFWCVADALRQEATNAVDILALVDRLDEQA